MRGSYFIWGREILIRLRGEGVYYCEEGRAADFQRAGLISLSLSDVIVTSRMYQIIFYFLFRTTLSLGTDLANVQVEIPTVTINGAMFFGGKPGGSDGFIGNIRQVYCNRE